MTDTPLYVGTENNSNSTLDVDSNTKTNTNTNELPGVSVTVKINTKSSQTFNNITSWVDWQSQIGNWAATYFPNSALVSVTNPWMDICADNYKFHLQLVLIDIPGEFRDSKTPKKSTQMKYTNLHHFVQQRVSLKIMHAFRNKIYIDNLQREFDQLLYVPAADFGILPLVSGIVGELEKIYGHPELTRTREFGQVNQVFTRWIIDLTSIASELPQQLQNRVKRLFHLVFDSIMIDKDDF
jgi:hypothetical protein